jgi:hypothetical protein
MVALGRLTSSLESQFVATLQSLPDHELVDLDIKWFAEYVARSCTCLSSHAAWFRLLESVAAFAQARERRSRVQLVLGRQRDTEEIKKWQWELSRAQERLHVRIS